MLSVLCLEDNMEKKNTKEQDADYDEDLETDSDLDKEIKAGEWQNLRKFKRYRNRSRQGKIIATYQAISNRLNQMVALYYKFVATNPRQAAKMLEDLKRLRLMQEILLQCLVWEPEGRLEEKQIPQEIWELIE